MRNLPILITVLCWSTLSILGVKTRSIDAFLSLGVALVIGGVIGLPFFKKIKTSLRTLVLGSTSILFFHYFLFKSFEFANPVQTNLVMYTWPVLLPLLAPFYIKGEVVTRNNILGLVTCFMGVAYLNVYDLINSGIGDSIKGIALAFGASLTWLNYTLLLKKWNDSSLEASFLFSFCAGVMSLIYFFIFRNFEGALEQINSTNIAYVVAIGLVPIALAYYCFGMAVKNSKPLIIGLMCNFTPIISTVFLVLFTGQSFSDELLIASFLVLFGSFVGSYEA